MNVIQGFAQRSYCTRWTHLLFEHFRKRDFFDLSRKIRWQYVGASNSASHWL